MKNRNELVAERLSQRLRTTRVGVVVDSIPGIDIGAVLEAMDLQDRKTLYVAGIGLRGRQPRRRGVQFEATIEHAVKWRNDPTCAGSIIVFMQGDVAKSRSLEDFDHVCTRDIAQSLLEMVSTTIATNERERAVWQALIELCDRFPLQLIEDYVSEVESLGKKNDRMARSLWRLGLVCDDRILARGADPVQRLLRNREAIEQLGRLSEKSRKRMAQVVTLAKGKERRRFQDAYESVMDYFRRGQDDVLKDLTLDIIEQLIRAGKPLPQLKPGDEEEEGRPEQPPAVQRPLRGRQLDKAIGRIVASGNRKDRQELKQLADDLREVYEETDGNSEDGIVIGEQAVDPGVRDETRTILDTIAYVCNADAWGGCFKSDAENTRSAFRQFSPKQVQLYNPMVGDSENALALIELLSRFDETLKNTSTFEQLFRRISIARAKIAGDAPLLAHHPFIFLTPDKTLRKNIGDYLCAFSELLAMFRRHEAELHTRNATASRVVAQELLRLDVIHVCVKGEWRAVLTPMHPFFLWRYLEILKSIDSGESELTDKDREHLAEALAELPQVMHFLVSTPGMNTQPLILPLAGSLFELPAYENHTNKYLGCDGLDYLGKVLDLWLEHSPYSERQIRLAVLNSPDLRETLSEAATFLSDHSATHIVLDAYWTQGNPMSPESRHIVLEHSDHDVIDCLQEGRIVVSVIPLASVQDIESRLQARPVHVLLTFDQGQFEVGTGLRGKNLAVSPLVITYKYEYDEIYGTGTILPSSDADEGIFSDFNFLVQRSADFPAGKVPQLMLRDLPNVLCLNAALKSGNVQWIVCADRSLASYRMADGLALNECRCGQREVGIWALSSEQVLNNVTHTLAQYTLNPDQQKLLSIFKRFNHIAATGWKSLLQTSDTVPAATENARKAILGTVFAAAWYCEKYPKALIATLDSELASRWLLGKRSDQTRADLIGLRPGDAGDVIVEPIEVKAHANDADLRVERVEGTRRRRLVGHAIDQITSMVRMIRPIFGGEDHQPLFTPARREALKYQLHRECFRDRHSAEDQKYWYHLLQEVFARPNPNVAVKVKGKAIHVRFEDLGEIEDCVEDSESSLELVRLGTREIQRLIGSDLEPEPVDVEPLQSRRAKRIDAMSTREHAPRTVKHEGAIAKTDVHASPAKQEKGHIGKNRARSRSVDPQERTEIDELVRGFRLGCQSFSVELADCRTDDVVVGPNVIRLYFKLGRGQRLDPLQKVLEDIGREMARTGLVITQIRDSDRLALDVPRKTRDCVRIADALSKLPEQVQIEELPIPIGVTPEGEHIIRDLGKMPHLLVGGTTGAGKTIFLYGLLSAMLSTHPDHKRLRLLISTSKREDFSLLDGLKHLEGRKVIDDAAVAIRLLQSKIQEEFNTRGNLLTQSHCRDIVAYNLTHKDKMSPVVILVDEFADLADQLGSDRKAKQAFYTNIRRVAQLGRSRGMHLVLCTQRPSAELVPSDIRSLLNSRVAFRVNKREDSRMIIDDFGAEQLQLHGDMLFRDDKSLTRCLGYFTDVEFLGRVLAKCR